MYNPLSDSVYNVKFVYALDECVDGHWLIWGSHANRAHGKVVDLVKIQRVIGVTSHRERVEQKAYEIAKSLAKIVARIETYGWYNTNRGVPFIDETSRAKESPLASVQA